MPEELAEQWADIIYDDDHYLSIGLGFMLVEMLKETFTAFLYKITNEEPNKQLVAELFAPLHEELTDGKQ